MDVREQYKLAWRCARNMSKEFHTKRRHTLEIHMSLALRGMGVDSFIARLAATSLQNRYAKDRLFVRCYLLRM